MKLPSRLAAPSPKIPKYLKAERRPDAVGHPTTRMRRESIWTLRNKV